MIIQFRNNCDCCIERILNSTNAGFLTVVSQCFNVDIVIMFDFKYNFVLIAKIGQPRQTEKIHSSNIKLTRVKNQKLKQDNEVRVLCPRRCLHTQRSHSKYSPTTLQREQNFLKHSFAGSRQCWT